MTFSHHRLEFIAQLKEQIVGIGSYRNGKRTSGSPVSIDPDGTIGFPLRFRGRCLRLSSGETSLTGETLDDLIAQLEQLKEVAAIGGLDSILDAAMNCSE